MTGCPPPVPRAIAAKISFPQPPAGGELCINAIVDANARSFFLDFPLRAWENGISGVLIPSSSLVSGLIRSFLCKAAHPT